jgi:hypothetical protein
MNQYKRNQRNLERNVLVNRLLAAEAVAEAAAERERTNHLVTLRWLAESQKRVKTLEEQIESKDNLAQGYRDSIAKLQNKLVKLCLDETHLRALLISSWT